MADESSKKIKRSMLGVEYLAANANSHVWPFSAFAELIDNAYDPDAMANKIYIDKCQLDDKVCLTIQDNGCGMDFEHLWKMMSFGFSEKWKYTDKDHLPIGQYGNGFKSGSMRLAKDALVFTYKSQDECGCIGFLSQSYLDAIDSEEVLLPLITYKYASKEMHLQKDEGWRENLDAILEHSVYHQEENLIDLLYGLQESGGGTKILLFNLAMHSERSDDLELDFESDPTDIQLKHDYFGEESDNEVYCAPSYKYSLKEYCCILYRLPRLRIFLRGKTVRSVFVEKSLSITQTYKYNFEKKHATKITIGMHCKNSAKRSDANNYGLMLYNKKRLITAYNKIGLQLAKPPSAIGVVIIAELNHLTPIHNKQDFKREERPFINAMRALREKLKVYWEDMEPTIKRDSQTKKRLPDWNWVICDDCEKWRRLPQHVDPNQLPQKWYCYMNPDISYSSCPVPEELEHDDEIQISSRRGSRHPGRKASGGDNPRRSVGCVTPSVPTRTRWQASGKTSSVQDSKESTVLPAESSRTPEKRNHGKVESTVNSLSLSPPATKERRLNNEGKWRMNEAWSNSHVPSHLPQTETEPENLDLDHSQIQTEPSNLDFDHPQTETEPENLDLDYPPTETEPNNLDFDHPQTETKPENLDLDRPSTETQTKNLDLDHPQTETKPENLDLDHPQTETESDNSPKRCLKELSNTVPLTHTLNKDKGVQTEQCGSASNAFYALQARMNEFKKNVVQLLHRIEPEIDLEAIGHDIETVVQRMLVVDCDLL